MSYFIPYVDATGPHLPTYEDRMEKLIADYKAIFGQDLYLGEDTRDYQLLSLFAKALDDLSSLMLSSFTCMDPNLATGQALDLLVTLQGLSRLPGETDAALRLRYSLTLSEKRPSALSSLETALRQVPYLTDVHITVDEEAHSLAVVVHGGGTSNVAKTILKYKPLGISTVGSTSSTVTGEDGFPHTIRFSRARDLVTQTQILIVPLEGYQPEKASALLRSGVADYFSSLHIGQKLLIPLLSAHLSRLEDPEHPTFAISSVAVTTARGSSNAVILPEADEILRADENTVTVRAL